MQKFDALVIGSGRVARAAVEAIPRDRSVAVLPVPEGSDDILTAWKAALTGEPVAPVTEWPSNVTLVSANDVRARRTLIAAGGTWRAAAGALTPTQALLQARAGDRFTVHGSGALAALTADRLSAIGATVRFAGSEPAFLSLFEPAIANRLREGWRAAGLLEAADPAATHVEAEAPLPAVGTLGERRAVLKADGSVAVDETMRTSEPGLFAAGAVTGTVDPDMELRQAAVAGHNLFAPFYDRRRVDPNEPDMTVWPFRTPVVAASRMNGIKAEATTDALTVAVSRSKRSGELTGAQVAGERAFEWGAYFDLAIRAGATASDLLENERLNGPSAGAVRAALEALAAH